MLASIMRLRDLDLPVRDRTTLSRRRADLTVVKTMSTASRPVNVMIGATGLTVFGADEWQRERRTEAGCHLKDGLVVLGLWRTGDLARGGSGTISRMLPELILDEPELSPRELAARFTDTHSTFVSEASVYRLLKAQDLIRHARDGLQMRDSFQPNFKM